MFIVSKFLESLSLFCFPWGVFQSMKPVVSCEQSINNAIYAYTYVSVAIRYYDNTKMKQCSLQKVRIICDFCFFLGFAIEQGLTESILGILRGVGALFGVAGTLMFPILRKNCGIEKTGLITFTILTLCLVPCVVSVFIDGSLFQPDYLQTKTDGLSDGNASVVVTGNITNDSQYPWLNSNSVLSVWVLMGSIVIARFGEFMYKLESLIFN